MQTEVWLLTGRWEAQAGFDFLQQRGLIVLQLDDEASLHLCGEASKVFLAMHGIKGNDAVRDH